MATTTPNFGWPVPTSTDYVKDGATAIEALGDAIDATVATLTPGLVFLRSTTFNGVASQAIGSNASPLFNSTYDNYKIFINFTTSGTADATLNLKMRLDTTDASTNYFWGYPSVQAGSSVSAYSNSGGTAGWTIADYDSGTSGYATSAVIEMCNPFAAQFTSGTLSSSGQNTSGTFIGLAGTFNHRTATSYNAINLIPTSGNISGVVTVYGYKKA